MRNFFKALALVAVLSPAAAFGAVSTTQHNLSVSGPNTAVRATTEAGICVFCHTPHGANQQRAIWNHVVSGNASFNWGGTTQTTTGTPLPTALASFSSTTLKCLSCHDGSVALGSVTNAGGGVAGVIALGGTHQTGGLLNGTAGANRVGFGGNLSGNHPVGIPYAGQTGSSATVAGNYAAVVVGGTCTSASGTCTAVSNAINLTNVAGVRQVDCTSCHDVHGTALPHMLTVTDAASAVCLACHLQ